MIIASKYNHAAAFSEMHKTVKQRTTIRAREPCVGIVRVPGSGEPRRPVGRGRREAGLGPLHAGAGAAAPPESCSPRARADSTGRAGGFRAAT